MDLTSVDQLLIVPAEKISFSQYLSLITLAQSLSGRNKSIQIFDNEKVEKYQTVVAMPANVQVVNGLSPRKLILSFAKPNQNVENVQWQQTETELNIHITMDQGQLNLETMKSKSEGVECDAILFFGDISADQQAAFMTSIASQVTDVKTLHLGSAQTGQQPMQGVTTGENLPVSVYEIVSKTEGQINYDYLLAAFLLDTARFKHVDYQGNIFKLLSELVEHGANLAKANEIVELYYQAKESNKRSNPVATNYTSNAPKNVTVSSSPARTN